MEPQREDRRLTTILAADVVGYSRLMAADESWTLAQLKTHRRELIEPKTTEHHGRVVKLMGDGALMEFGSVVDAVRFAVDVQKTMTERNTDVPDELKITYRIGINIGDIIVEGDDIYGDGVNVAARLEGLADPGGICIARNVFDQVKSKLDISFQDMGEQELKNIPEPVLAYRVVMRNEDVGPAAVNAVAPLTLPDKPSIAVLPFDNMSGDPEQEHFSDGITEDIITALSRVRQFFVIARNTTFTYKGKAIDVQAVAKDLGVRYVLEGSVRKGGNRVRITAQLIDGGTGNHIWAERYDRDMEDIFAVQDEITLTVVGAIEPELNRAEQERALRSSPDNFVAWEYLQRGWSHYYKFSEKSANEAEKQFQQAIELDPKLALAYAGFALVKCLNVINGISKTPAEDLDQGLKAAKTAVEIDDRDSTILTSLGMNYFVRREHSLAIDAFQRSLALNNSSATAHHWLGFVYAFDQRPEDAIAEQEMATRLSPNDPFLWGFMNVRAHAYLNSGDFEHALEWVQKSLRQPITARTPYIVRVVTLSHLDKPEEAQVALDELLRVFPDISIQKVMDLLPFKHKADIRLWEDGLRKVGMNPK